MLKLDVEPIFMDTFLHVLKFEGGNKTTKNLGAMKIAGYLDVGWIFFLLFLLGWNEDSGQFGCREWGVFGVILIGREC